MKYWRCVCLVLSLGLALAVSAQPVVDMDGSADEPLYDINGALAIQDTATHFGDATLGQPDIANGSELDGAYAVVYDDNGTKWLYMVLAGNFETNGNAVEIFFDTREGGQNQLLAENPARGGLQRMGPGLEGPGLIFETGFTADFYVTVNAYGDPPIVSVDYAELYDEVTAPFPVDYFVGSGWTKCDTLGGELTGGDPGAPTMYCTIDNSNTAGVDGDVEGHLVQFGGGAGVLTGLEIAIPLSALGDPTGSFDVCAFINSSAHDYVSNQVLGGLFGQLNLGEPRLVDFSALGSVQKFTVPAEPVPTGACCVGTTCSITTEAGCAGTYLGDNTDCEGNPCDTVPMGACYVLDAQGYTGTCELTTADDCAAQGGAYQGDDTDCDDFQCVLPRLGACCMIDGSCDVMSEEDCLLIPDAWYAGDFTDCTACITTPAVTGEMNGWTLNQDLMTETFEGSGIWVYDYAGLTPDGRYEFKITFGSSWDGAIPSTGNSWLFADGAGAVTITYDANTYDDGWEPATNRIGVSVDPGTWTAVGPWQGWDNANPATAMVAQGDGTYMYEQSFLPGTYEWKAVVTGSWDSIGSDNRSVNATPQSFTTDETNNTARMYVDPLAGTIRVEVVPGGVEPLGACCLSDGTCELLTEADCLVHPLYVEYKGDYTNCRACYTPAVTGTMNGWTLNQDLMTENPPGSGIWERSYDNLTPGGREEFKITFGDSWALSLPDPSNSWCYVDGTGHITIIWDSNTYDDGWSPTVDRIGLDYDLGTWTATGDFLSEIGGTDWVNNDPNGHMEDQGDGTYLKEITNLPPGTYNWKAVVTGTWDSISWDGRSVNTANWQFEVTEAGQIVRLWVKPLVGVAMTEVLAGDPCAGQVLGDANCDGLVNAFDIDAFILALTDPAAWEAQYGAGCDLLCVADCNEDGDVNAFDIDAFIALLTG